MVAIEYESRYLQRDGLKEVGLFEVDSRLTTGGRVSRETVDSMTRKGLVWIKIVRKKTFKRDWRMLHKAVDALKRKWRVVCEPLPNYERNISIIGIVCNSETNNILIFSSFWFP